MAKDTLTEQLILNAARDIFIQKGYDGARMQEIADKAGINKALLHYYYRGKEQLFHTVLTGTLELIIPAVNKLIASDNDLHETVVQFVSLYVDFLAKYPYLPAFLIHELNRNAGMMPAFLQQLKSRPAPQAFITSVGKEVAAGNIKPIKPLHLLINILSLCIFPAVARPMMQAMLGIDDEGYQQFMQERKDEVTRFIFNAINL
jgi:TetR/AcrR family transcriptional regulator